MDRSQLGGRVNLTTLNVLDGLIIIVLGWNLIRGFNKGFVEEIISITGIVLSIYLSYQLATPVASLLVKKPDQTTTLISGIFIFAIFFFITKYIAFHLNKKLNETALGILNNILGFLFGIVRGWLLASVFVFLVAALSPDGYLVKRSSLGGLAVPVIDRIVNLLPLKDKKDDPLLKNWKKAEGILWKNFVLRKYLEGETPPKTKRQP